MKTISKLLAVVLLSASAYAQVPIVGSYSYMNGLPGLPLAQQGFYTGWNYATLGESDFFTHPGTGAGGYRWYNGSSASPTLLMALTQAGVLTVATVNANTNGTHTGAVVGNASTATALAALPGACAGGQFPAGILASGAASVCQTHLVGLADTATALAAVSPCGSGFATGISTTGTSTGCGTNIATATALAATPSPCGTGLYAGGVNASGTGINCSPLWLMATGTGCTTASPGASQCTATVNWDSPGFSGAPPRFMCGGISPTGFPQGPYVTAVTGSSITVQVSNGQSGEGIASGFATVTCWGQQ